MKDFGLLGNVNLQDIKLSFKVILLIKPLKIFFWCVITKKIVFFKCISYVFIRQ